MDFRQAFDPFRALGEAWRLVRLSPVPLLVGGAVLTLLLGRHELRSVQDLWEEPTLRLEGPGDLIELAVTAFVGGISLLAGAAAFLLACLLGVTLPRSVARVLATGSCTFSELLSPAGRFLPMLLVQLMVFGLRLALLLAGGLATALGAAVDTAGIPLLGAAVGVAGWSVAMAGWLYVYLGVRLAEPAVALEEIGPADAVRRSWALAEGRRVRLALYLLALRVAEALGVLLCVVGVLLTGTLARVALAESYLRLAGGEPALAHAAGSRPRAGATDDGGIPAPA